MKIIKKIVISLVSFWLLTPSIIGAMHGSGSRDVSPERKGIFEHSLSAADAAAPETSGNVSAISITENMLEALTLENASRAPEVHGAVIADNPVHSHDVIKSATFKYLDELLEDSYMVWRDEHKKAALGFARTCLIAKENNTLDALVSACLISYEQKLNGLVERLAIFNELYAQCGRRFEHIAHEFGKLEGVEGIIAKTYEDALYKKIRKLFKHSFELMSEEYFNLFSHMMHDFRMLNVLALFIERESSDFLPYMNICRAYHEHCHQLHHYLNYMQLYIAGSQSMQSYFCSNSRVTSSSKTKLLFRSVTLIKMCCKIEALRFISVFDTENSDIEAWQEIRKETHATFRVLESLIDEEAQTLLASPYDRDINWGLTLKHVLWAVREDMSYNEYKTSLHEEVFLTMLADHFRRLDERHNTIIATMPREQLQSYFEMNMNQAWEAASHNVNAVERELAEIKVILESGNSELENIDFISPLAKLFNRLTLSHLPSAQYLSSLLGLRF